MPRIVEVVPGDRVALETDRWDVDCDRSKGVLFLRHKPRLGRPREREVPLGSVRALRFYWTEKEAITLAELRRKAALSKEHPELAMEEVDALSPAPKKLKLRLDENGDGRESKTWIPIPLPEVDSVEKLVELAMNLAAAAELAQVGVFEIPGGEPEIVARRESGEGFRELPLEAVREGGVGLSQVAVRASRDRAVPPFEPADLEADLEVREWRPGSRVVLARRFSPLSVLALPFVFLVFAGPALGMSRAARGVDIDYFTVGIVSFFGLALGAGAAYLVVRYLPKSLIFDWDEGTWSLRSATGRIRLPLRALKHLRLTITSGSTNTGGEGGGGGQTYYYTELHAEVAKGARSAFRWALEGDPKLLETERAGSREGALRQVLPLSRELARALGVKLELKG